MPEKRLARIRLMMGPGTLPSRGSDRMDMTRYRKSGKPQMTGDEMLAEIPEIAAIADVSVDAGNPHGIAGIDDMCRLSLALQKVLDDATVDGVVFVQGTNSIEETAYFLHLTLKSSKPIVVTGAQRPFTAISTDAHLNLYDACRVAACAETGGKGVVVVTNGEINGARDVTKTHSYRLQTFRGRDLGLLGYADADAIVYYHLPAKRHTARSEFVVRPGVALPRVEIIYVGVTSQPGLARAAVQAGAKGLVIAGTGAGSLGNLDDELGKIASEGIVVARSARVGEGRIIRDDNWQRPGMVSADNLSPQKASLLLALAMAHTGNVDDIQRMFDQY
jgi:L-asparaginase